MPTKLMLQETQADGEEVAQYTLFDTGPDSRTIARNIASLKVPIERIDRVILSHWHADHSGGMLAFLRARNEALKSTANISSPCVLDLHPDRPIARGIAPLGKLLCRLPADPEFEELEDLGGIVQKHHEGHAVANNTVWVSGEIPRVTKFETGLLGAVRWSVRGDGTGVWLPEEVGAGLHTMVTLSRLTLLILQQIMDERYAAIDVIGKGLVIFSA